MSERPTLQELAAMAATGKREKPRHLRDAVSLFLALAISCATIGGLVVVLGFFSRLLWWLFMQGWRWL